MTMGSGKEKRRKPGNYKAKTENILLTFSQTLKARVESRSFGQSHFCGQTVAALGMKLNELK